jgi:aryl carrier-like protein
MVDDSVVDERGVDRHGGLPAAVRAAWAAVLGHQDFGDRDNFFHVGGHSLRAIQLMKGLSRDLGIRLPVRLLFDHPTVHELTEAVHARSQTTDG